MIALQAPAIKSLIDHCLSDRPRITGDLRAVIVFFDVFQHITCFCASVRGVCIDSS